MKWLLAFCICLISCGQKNTETTTDTTTDITTKPTQPDTTIQIQKQPGKLIVPGESVGNISIGTNAADLEKILGKPDASDAAMGKAWLTWNGERDEHNNATTLNIYTTYQDSTMQQKTVQQIRTTSSLFSTNDGIRVYSSLETIRKEFPEIEKLAHYTDEGRDIVIYDEIQKGIAFEIAAAGQQQICTGIIIHKKGEVVTNVYIFFHPGMKLYQ
jgi:hypothetical protein